MTHLEIPDFTYLQKLYLESFSVLKLHFIIFSQIGIRLLVIRLLVNLMNDQINSKFHDLRRSIKIWNKIFWTVLWKKQKWVTDVECNKINKKLQKKQPSKSLFTWFPCTKNNPSPLKLTLHFHFSCCKIFINFVSVFMLN